MSGNEVNIFGLNLTERTAMTDEGEIGDIVNFIDFEGDETQDLAIAEFAIIQWRNDRMWSCTALEDYTTESPLT